MITTQRARHLHTRPGREYVRTGERQPPARRAFAAAATLLFGVFGLGVAALSSAPSGAASTATLFVDNVNGTCDHGLRVVRALGAYQTIQEAVNVAEALSDTSVTLNVAGSSTIYHASVQINLPSSGGDSLVIQGTGSTLPTLDSQGSASDITIENTSTGAVTVDQMTISDRKILGAATVRRRDRQSGQRAP